MIEHKGIISAKGKRIGVVVSRFNERVTKRLLEAAYEAFLHLGGDKGNFQVYWVPGAMEIPLSLQALAQSKNFDGLLALGCVIRGETPHFEYVAAEVSKGVVQVQLSEGVPIAYGIVTADTLDQALERSGGKHGNRGWDALMSLLETISVLEKIRSETKNIG